MLYTNLYHLENALDLERTILQHEKVLIVCGRMGLQCVTIYRIAEALEKEYKEVRFCDLEYDNPESKIVCESLNMHTFSNLPFTLYYFKGKVVRATSGIQTKEQIEKNINEYFQ